MTKDINLHVAAGVTELVVRQGEALKQGHEQPINLNGTLQAPWQYLEGKLIKTIPPQPGDCHIEIEKYEGRISLIVDDQHPFKRSIIVGSLQADYILQAFKINSDHRWTIQEFLKFVKTMRFYFADRAAHGALITSLQKWQVKVERVITEHNDNKGNSNFQLQTKVEQSVSGDSGLISKFDLLIPIFQGYHKWKFTVEIGLDPKATSVMLYLISDDLIELEIGQREKLIADELANFKDFPCSKVVLS